MTRPYRTPHGTPDIPNLDAMSRDDLMTFWSLHQRGRNRRMLGISGRDSMNIAGTLANYASNKAAAMICRLDGRIADALVYEHICDGLYGMLPENCKW